MRFTLSRPPVVLVLALGAAEWSCSRLPDPSSPRYEETVAAFYRGVAAAQAGESSIAATAFDRVTQLAPDEPAGWANRGLIALQRRELDQAITYLREARSLAPEHPDVLLVLAAVADERGMPDTLAAHLRRALERDSSNLRAGYMLAQTLAETGRSERIGEALRLLERLLAVAPGNLTLLVEQAHLGAAVEDGGAVVVALDAIDRRTALLDLPLIEPLEEARGAVSAGDFSRARAHIVALHNLLRPLPPYQDDQAPVVLTPSRMELVLTRFVRLPAPDGRSAPPETDLTFVPDTLSVGADSVGWVRASWLSDQTPLALFAIDRDTLWVSPEPGIFQALPFTADPPGPAPGHTVIAPFDYDYDFRIDLALATAGGLRLFRHDDSGNFTDVTEQAIPAAVAGGAYRGVWPADLDMEGDLDLVAAPLDGAPTVLRNRGDGSFESYPEFTSVAGLQDFVWADLDSDGDPDATLLDAAGRIHLFLNGRSAVPQFRGHAVPDTLGDALAITAADWNKDATLDLILLHTDGTVRLLTLTDGRWEGATLGEWPDMPAGPSHARIFAADIDNNGDLDIVASVPERSRVWLGSGTRTEPLAPLQARVTAVADITGDGRLDLIAVSPQGKARLLVNDGRLDYYSTGIRPQAAQVLGDRRVNSFGIGGEIEVRAGLLYQKQVIDGPAIHIGLGEHPQIDVARIVWPNGSVQAEFNVPATNATILTRQRLKGSCPWIFTYDGTGMQFVTDFIWRSALGLRINAQGDATVIHGEDWVKIRGDQLVPRDGFYDIRITAELWETHFFDHVSLMAVDHPRDTEVFVDERFVVPAPEQAVHVTRPLRAVSWARDQTGRDVTEVIREQDQRFLDTFTLGPFQGIAEDHYVEIHLTDDPPAEESLVLVATGWVYPTDASLNVAVSQGSHIRPRGVQLEVPDGRGGWSIAQRDLGFPAGKTKTLVIDLANVFADGTPRRVRLRTNMEIYWDRIAWAVNDRAAQPRIHRLHANTAELRYRGFSATSSPGRSTPETPSYEQIATTAPLWRDLAGFHTRFGDVRPLTASVDDRLVIMNAGDELLLRFPAPPPPPEGWTRDFVLLGDGWVKDGDYNTGFSTTVRPLPYHGLRDYSTPPGSLEDDPGYQRHPADWRDYHTRYVTPRAFHRALVPAPKR